MRLHWFAGCFDRLLFADHPTRGVVFMKQTQKSPLLAPYGSVAFLPMVAKVGAPKVESTEKLPVATEQRTVVRRQAEKR